MISPTIGRVVLVRRLMNNPEAVPALVARVWNDRLINVGGFDESGRPFSWTSLTMLQDDDTPPEHGVYAEWMPYQKGQAAKTEALEALQRQPAPPPVDNAFVAPGCEQFAAPGTAIGSTHVDAIDD